MSDRRIFTNRRTGAELQATLDAEAPPFTPSEETLALTGNPQSIVTDATQLNQLTTVIQSWLRDHGYYKLDPVEQQELTLVVLQQLQALNQQTNGGAGKLDFKAFNPSSAALNAAIVRALGNSDYPQLGHLEAQANLSGALQPAAPGPRRPAKHAEEPGSPALGPTDQTRQHP